MTLNDAVPGTILHASWGYEQTNHDFYQVVERRGKATLILRQLRVAKESEGWARDKVTPLKDQFTDDPPLTRRIGKHGHAKVNAYTFLHIWEGRPMHATSYA